MAGSNYRSLIPADGTYDLGYFTNDVKHVATVRVGEFDNPPTVFSIMTALVPTPLLPRGGFEFMFAVIEFDVRSGMEVRHFSGLDTKAKIPGATDREACVEVICGSLDTLLSRSHAPTIFMQACDANLPLRARRKYEKVVEVFIKAGYHVERQPAYHGRDSWMMERIDA